MNEEMLPSADRDDFDRPPEPEMAAWFAASAPPARPVDVATIFRAADTAKRPCPSVLARGWSPPAFRRVAALVPATAGAAAVLVLSLLFWSGSPNSFAEVKAQVARTRSMTMKQTVAVVGKPAITTRAAFLSDGLGRVDMPDGTYTIADSNGNALTVWPSKKTATVIQGATALSNNVYAQLHDIVTEKSVRLPDETLDGRQVNVYKVEWNAQIRKQYGHPLPPMKVWVDSQTKLPIRLEPISGEGEKPLWICYDIVFDQPLDRATFDMTPPAGYKVIHQEPSPSRQ